MVSVPMFVEYKKYNVIVVLFAVYLSPSCHCSLSLSLYNYTSPIFNRRGEGRIKHDSLVSLFAYANKCITF